MKVAIVCDWLTNVGGAEKVLLEVHKLYPKAPIYTSKYAPKGIDWFKTADVRTGWLQVFPVCMRRLLAPLRQRWFARLDLSEYDLIISVTGAEAKGVKSGKWLYEHGRPSKNPKGIHVSYCHVPTQYYWQMYDAYVKDPGFKFLNPVVRFCFKLMVGPLRRGDKKAAQVPDYFITISEYAKGLMKKYYDREAVVIHPPVEIDEFRMKAGPASTSDYYIITSRQVNWKRIDLAVKACAKSNRRLLVVGEGPEHERLVKMAEGCSLIEFVPLVGKKELAKLLAGARGYIFPSLEPFGIAPVEALATGCPVIAYGAGGALDYVEDGVNGVLFERQTVKALVEAMERFEKMKFDRAKVVKSAEGFDVKRFDREVRSFVDEKLK
ncbi:glycosyltransferase [Candidatus Saccharibacteria bacterium]|nr:glycosyltransferase [Candidatus Saccharibacteria bacterium]